MGSVWKRIQRVGKKAAKFEFFAQLQSFTIECKKEKKWLPTKLTILWQRGVHRRKYSKPFNFQPGIAKPYRGVMELDAEELETVCTLYKDDKPDAPFEPKEWTFVILDESSGRKKPIAQGAIDMAKYATIEPSSKAITVKLKPGNTKVLKAHLDIVLSCLFLREGKATDEDMLSVASMMSLNEIDDFDFDDDNRGNKSSGSHSINLSGSGQIFNDSGTSSLGESFNSNNDHDTLSVTRKSPSPRGFGSRSNSPNLSNLSRSDSTGSNSIKSIPNSSTLVSEGKAGNHITDNIKDPTTVSKSENRGNAIVNNKDTKPDQAKDILDWCQKTTQGYRGVKITNMTTSWRSGLAFCAILHSFHPELVDFSNLSPHNIKENNKLAFEAFDSLGISKILDPNDMVRAATPDRLSVMTYLHQIKTHFMNNTSASSISTLLSQYEFLSGNDDALANINSTSPRKAEKKKMSNMLSPSRHQSQVNKNANNKNNNNNKQPSSSSLNKVAKEVEIDEIDDTAAIDCIFEKMKQKDKQQFHQKTLDGLNMTKSPMVSAAQISVDEDDLLNDMIGTDSPPPSPPSKPTDMTTKKEDKNQSCQETISTSCDQKEKNDIAKPVESSQTSGNNLNPFIDSDDETCTGGVDQSGKTSTIESDTNNCRFSSELGVKSGGEISNLQNETSEFKPEGANTSNVSTEVSNNTSLGSKNFLKKLALPAELKVVSMTPTSSVVKNDEVKESDKVCLSESSNSDSGMFNLQQDKQEQIQERARQLISQARLKAQQMYDENQMDANLRAQKFMEGQRLRDNAKLNKLDKQDDRRLQLKSQASDLLSETKDGMRGVSPTEEHNTSGDTAAEIEAKNNAEFRKNPFTLVKKKVSLKPLPADKYLKPDASSTKPAKTDMENLVESRTVNLQSFTQSYNLKPKRDVAAEVAAELARVKEEEKTSKDKDEVDAPVKSDSEEEEVPVPVDDYFYELENFNLRSVDEYFNHELATLEKETKALDKVAQKLEVELRKAMASGDKEEEIDLLQEWFNLVNKKNNIIRRQDEIAFLAQADDLEKQCEIINRELRVLSGMEESEKTEETHRREESLVSQLVTLVNQRNDLVQIEDKQQKETAQDEVHVQQVLLGQSKQTKPTKVGSMVGWVWGIKSKILNQ